MAEAATHAGHDPDRVSFVAALRITRQTLAHPGTFPPLTSAAATARAGRLPTPPATATEPAHGDDAQHHAS